MSGLATVLSHPAVWRGAELGRVSTPSVPSGYAELDAELPGGGWPTAALTEILPQHEGIGELRILGHALAKLAAEGRWLAWIAPPYLPYAPALQAASIDLSRLLVIRTRSPRETLWAFEQTLRSQTCGAVLAWPELVHQAIRQLGRGRHDDGGVIPAAALHHRGHTVGTAAAPRHAGRCACRSHPQASRRCAWSQHHPGTAVARQPLVLQH